MLTATERLAIPNIDEILNKYPGLGKIVIFSGSDIVRALELLDESIGNDNEPELRESFESLKKTLWTAHSKCDPIQNLFKRTL